MKEGAPTAGEAATIFLQLSICVCTQRKEDGMLAIKQRDTNHTFILFSQQVSPICHSSIIHLEAEIAGEHTGPVTK